MSFAVFAPQREHFDRAWTWVRGVEPKAITACGAVSVRDAPQPVQSTRRAAPKRTRSPVVRTCLVDILRG